MVGDAPHRASGWQIFRRVLREQDSHWRQFATILALGLFATPLVLIPPLCMRIAVDGYLGDKPLPGFLDAIVPSAWSGDASGKLAFAAGLLIFVALIDQTLKFSKRVLQARTRERLVMGFRMRLFPHVERLSLAYHDRQGPSDATFRVLLDTAVMPALLLDGMIPILTAAFTLVVMIAVLLTISWQLSLAAAIAGPLLLAVSWPFARRLRRQWHKVKEIDSSAMSLLQEVFSAVRVIKAFGTENTETERLHGLAQEGVRAKVRVAVTQGQFNAILGITNAIGRAAILVVGIYQVKTGSLSLGEMVMAAALLVQVYSPMQALIGQAVSIQKALTSAERALKLLDEMPEVVERPGARAVGRARGGIRYESVSFEYDAGKSVLDEVSFEVQSGQRIGIVGPTGAGKTTLVNLLTRLYDPDRGRILLDGVDLRDIKLDSLRDQFAIVLQEPVLFHKSIAENIAYARPGASMEELEEAARLADAHEFIQQLPDGYRTRVGDRGQRLSGGERQRISLARAFLKDAPVLILDEPTSSVDMRTEAAILGALRRLMEGRTTFIIAHRPSTLQHCDRVLVLEGGRVVAFAAPDALGHSLDAIMRGEAWQGVSP